jgi:hypothetical protein
VEVLHRDLLLALVAMTKGSIFQVSLYWERIKNTNEASQNSGKASKLLFLHGCMNAMEKPARGFV